MSGPYAVPSDRLERRFQEKNPPLAPGAARREAERCLYCADAPCITACPTRIDVPTFIKRIASGHLRGAARTILEANVLGATCARVCPVEVLCEGACVWVREDRPAIAIGRLQRYALDEGAAPGLLPKAPASGKSVGLVGAGPASLACAGRLALHGHSAVLYEKRSLPGGLATTGVAPYKFRTEDALREVDFVRSLGVTIRTGVTIGEDLAADELLATHEAVFLGPGLGPDSRLGIPGEDGPGVVGAVEWIERMKNGEGGSLENVERALIVGGGNTAVDAARALRGLGVPSVQFAYRRSEHEMKAYDHELWAAKQEGAVVLDRTAVAEVLRRGGSASAVRLVHTDRDGKPTSREIATIPMDLVILAIGQARLTELVRRFPGVELDGRGRIVADPVTGRTGNPRVFAGGDARNGGKEVVNAVAEGQAAADAIDSMLREES
ncbi:MAG: FAD-dependent oxidoreductase [bacterium]